MQQKTRYTKFSSCLNTELQKKNTNFYFRLPMAFFVFILTSQRISLNLSALFQSTDLKLLIFRKSKYPRWQI